MRYFLIGLLGVAMAAGCDDSGSKPPAAVATPSATAANENVVKVAVMTDGTVLVNDEKVPIDSLGTKLDELGEIQEIWYHRESPESADPHENAMKAITEIASRKLPIAMYLDREFTNRLILTQQ